MKNLAILFAVFTLFALGGFAQTDEKAAVRVPLENYIKAHATGDPEFA